MISTDDFMGMNGTRFNPESTGALIKQLFDAVAESAMPRCRDGSGEHIDRLLAACEATPDTGETLSNLSKSGHITLRPG